MTLELSAQTLWHLLQCGIATCCYDSWHLVTTYIFTVYVAGKPAEGGHSCLYDIHCIIFPIPWLPKLNTTISS